MTPKFLIDAASFQGTVNWWTVAIGCSGGWEKVTQGTTYANPFWAAAQPAMAAQIAHGFTPGAYLFMEAGDGAAQADWFAARAGPLPGFGVAIDAEPSFGLRRLAHVFPEVLTAGDEAAARATIARATSVPTLAEVRACKDRLAQHYPGKPVGGYLPHWFWGEQDTTFVDYLWASDYVLGQGRPQDLYQHVVPAQWAPYGGRAPALLQFTSSATVPGVNGLVDCSVYEGSDLVTLMVGAAAPGLPGEEEDMGASWLPNARVAPLALPNGVKRLRFVGLGGTETLKVDWIMGVSPDAPTQTVDVSYAIGAAGLPVPANCTSARVVRADLPAGAADYPLVGIAYVF